MGRHTVGLAGGPRLVTGILVAVLFLAATGCSKDASIDDSPGEAPHGNQPPPQGPADDARTQRPPPISGGTLLVTRDGTTALAADPDRDLVWVVDLVQQRLVTSLALEAEDEPGRLVEDDGGRVHVALRRGGLVVTLERVPTWRVAERRSVCAAPRGITWDAEESVLHVACLEGELVTLPASGTDGVRRLSLESDLRDVVVQDGHLWVSRFKAAEVLRVARDGQLLQRIQLPALQQAKTFAPSVAWRMVGGPGGLTVVHQQAQVDPVDEVNEGYGSRADPIVHATWTHLGGGAAPQPTIMEVFNGVLPVDVAVSPAGASTAIAFAGSSRVDVAPSAAAPRLVPNATLRAQDVVAVAFADESTLVAFTRTPELLIFQGDFASPLLTVVLLPGESREDAGRDVFHRDAGRGLSCASCHPEGGEDGRTWSFVGTGPRRTQPLWGGILDTAPFHWNGDLADMGALMHEVFVRRMGGSSNLEPPVEAVAQWLDTVQVPHLPAPRDPGAVERGRALFHSAQVGCATCHTGPKGTNTLTMDVGTGGALQVPHLLGLALRAPFLHTGCAPTLRERFGPCGGGDAHGRTSHLSAAELEDLLAYLQTR